MADTFDFNEFKTPITTGDIIDTTKDLATQTVDILQAGGKGFMKSIRSRTIPTDGEPPQIEIGGASWAQDPNSKDWRVKLSIPPIKSFLESPYIKRLAESTGGLCFPYTPTIIMSHQASYNAITPVHSNYPFFAYQNSSVDAMTLTGQFIVQNSLEGEYWVAMLHYLRSMTKMFYGETSNQGAPPPIVKLNGYGDYVFKDVPVVITNFTLDMPTDVDYLAVDLDFGFNSPDLNANKVFEGTDRGRVAYVPVESQVTVSLQPIYSRARVEQFSLDSFVKGDYINGGKGFI
jgi:hypothetical protein